MGNPVIHVKLLNDTRYESNKDVIGFGFVEEFSLVNLLNVKVSVDWDLNYIL